MQASGLSQRHRGRDAAAPRRRGTASPRTDRARDEDAARIAGGAEADDDAAQVVPTKALKANDKSKKKEPELFDATYRRPSGTRRDEARLG